MRLVILLLCGLNPLKAHKTPWTLDKIKIENSSIYFKCLQFTLICLQIIHKQLNIKHKTIDINDSFCLSVFGEFMEPHCPRNLIMMMIYCGIDILYTMRAEHFFISLPNLGISAFLIVNKRVGCGG